MIDCVAKCVVWWLVTLLCAYLVQGRHANLASDKVMIDTRRRIDQLETTLSPTTTLAISPSSLPPSNPNTLPTPYPSFQPTSHPTKRPISHSPTRKPTQSPTADPTSEPSKTPTFRPSVKSTHVPSHAPTVKATGSPTANPTSKPSKKPTFHPSVKPTNSPSEVPTTKVTGLPTADPTSKPSKKPTFRPSVKLTNVPSHAPTVKATGSPTAKPTIKPSKKPTFRPSVKLTNVPSKMPTTKVTGLPSAKPTSKPSKKPTFHPSVKPTHVPTNVPTAKVTGLPTANPTSKPSKKPTFHPSVQPTHAPSKLPTTKVTGSPTAKPTSKPSKKPMFHPSVKPTHVPTHVPTAKVTGSPTAKPMPTTNTPSTSTLLTPTLHPSDKSSSNRTVKPTANPNSRSEILNATVRLQMEPVPSIMDYFTKERLEQRMNIWLDQLFYEQFFPVKDVKSQVLSQRLVSLSRRSLQNLDHHQRALQSSGPYGTLLMDVKFEGKLTDTSLADADNRFKAKVLVFCSNSEHTSKLVTMLHEVNQGSSDTFFTKVNRISVTEEPKPRQRRVGAIVGGTIGCLTALVLILFVASWKKKRKARLAPKELSLIDSTPGNAGHRISSIDDNNNVITHSALAGLNSGRDSSSSIGEDRSQRTFQTLENIYSRENASQNSNDQDLGDVRTETATDMPGAEETTDYNDGISVSLDSYHGGTWSEFEGGSVATGVVKRPPSPSMSSDRVSSSASWYQRDCIAPPGKLSIVIDTSRYGPVVHEVKMGSPMENIIFPGDRIIAVDDEDTRAMSASAVTKIMAQKMDMRRKLTIVSVVDV